MAWQPSPITTLLADATKDARVRLSLTQEQLAARAGVPARTVQRIENAEREFRATADAVRLLQALHLELQVTSTLPAAAGPATAPAKRPQYTAPRHRRRRG